MATNNIGTAWITIKPTTKGFTNDIKQDIAGVDKEASNMVAGLSLSFENLGGTIATVLGSTFVLDILRNTISAIYNMVKTAIQSYAEYEQYIGGIEAMFKNSEDSINKITQVTKTASSAWKTLGLSYNDFYETFMRTYPLVKAGIDDENEAIGVTNRLMQLESDLSNTFGYSIEDAATAINWALKGTYNYIDNLNLGIKGTKAGFLEAAQSCGYFVDNVNDLTSAQILDVLEQYASKFGVIGRTAEEAESTVTGSMRAMEAAWSNLLTDMGNSEADLEADVDNFMEAFQNAMDNILPVVRRVGENLFPIIAEIIETIWGIIRDWLNDPQNEATLREWGAKLMNGLVDVAGAIGGAMVEALAWALWDGLLWVISNILALFQTVIEIIPNILNGRIGEFDWSFTEEGSKNFNNWMRTFGARGYATGGYTGDGNANDIAGVVHKGEYVLNATTTKTIGTETLDAMNDGFIPNGNTYFTINGYNRNPEELATIISRKLALKTRGVLA